MTIGTNKAIQNIPAPFHLVAFERARENWKNRKIEILLGSGLAITGLALIPLIGAYAAIVCGAGLAILSHGLFADPTSSPPLPLLQNKTFRARTAAPPKKSSPISLEDIPLPAKRAMGVLGSAAAFLAMNELLRTASAKPTPNSSTRPKSKTPTHPNSKIPTPPKSKIPPSPPTPTPHLTPASISKSFIISIGGSKPISHNVSDEPVSPILTPAEVATPLPSNPAKGPELGSVPISNSGDLTSPPPTPSTKPRRLSFFTVAETLGFFTASSTPDEILLSYLRSQPKDTICIFPSRFGPRRGLETLRISSNATKDPAESSPWEGIDFSKRPDQKILLFTASHEAVATSPTGKELALPTAARPTITITETSAKDFLQHSHLLFESLNEFDSDEKLSPPALTSGTTTTAPASLVSAPAASKKPNQPFTFLTVSEALAYFTTSSTPNDAFISYLRSQPKDRICVFPSEVIPSQGTGPLSLPAVKHSEPLNALESAFSGFDFSKASDSKILFFTASKKGIAADPSGLGLVPLDSPPQATITVTEMSVKDFASAQHSQRFFESLKEFYSGQMNRAGNNPLALPSGTPTTSPDLVSVPSPSTKPFSFLTVSEILQSSSPTPNDALFSYLLSQPKDAICVFPTGPLSLPATPSVAAPSPAFGSPLGGFDFLTPDRKILLFTAAQAGAAANPIGTELALPKFTGQPTITVTETTVKEFTSPQHVQFLLKSLNKFEELQAAKVSVPALTSGSATSPPVSVISAPSPSEKLLQPFSLSFLEASHPSDIELPLPTPVDQAPITVTETTVKDFASVQHAPFPLKSLNKFEELPLVKESVPALPSGNPTATPSSVISPSPPLSPLTAPQVNQPTSLDKASIPVTEPSVKYFASPQHAPFLFESLNKFEEIPVVKESVPALPSGNPAASPSSVISPSPPLSPLTAPQEMQPSSLNKPTIAASETTVKEFARVQHAQFILPLNLFNFDPLRLANPPSIRNSSNLLTSDPTPALTHDAQPSFTNGKHFFRLPPSWNKLNSDQLSDAALFANVASDLGLDAIVPGSKQPPSLDATSSAPHQTEPPIDMFSYLSSWIPSWFSSKSAQPEVPIFPSLEGDLPQPNVPTVTISSEQLTSNTSSDPACDEPLEFHPIETPYDALETFAKRGPSQFLLDARRKLKSDKRRHALVNGLINSVDGLNSSNANCKEDSNLALKTTTLPEARSKIKSDTSSHALVNGLIDSILGFNSSNENCKEQAQVVLQTTALEPTPAVAPHLEPPQESMLSYMSAWISSWLTSKSALPAVPILNLVAQPFCPANFTPLPTQLAIAPPTSTNAPATTLIASPAALAPNLALLAIATVLLHAANGTKKSLEFCPLTNSPQTGPLGCKRSYFPSSKEVRTPLFLGTLLSAGFTQAQSAAKTGVSFLSKQGGQALEGLRDHAAARIQSNWEERKQEFADYGNALKWTAIRAYPG